MNELITSEKQTMSSREITEGKFKEMFGETFSEEIISCFRKVQPQKKSTYLIIDNTTGLIKIGKAINPVKRLTSLKVSNLNLVLLATTDADVESAIHFEYKSYRVQREWFMLTQEQVESIIKKHSFKHFDNAK